MIKSMTGYGVATYDGEGSHYSVEIKSLNSKFLELNLRIPKEFNDKELFLRNECSKLLERGKVNITISTDTDNPLSKAAKINKTLLQHYYNELKSVAEELNAPREDLFKTALTLPEVISYSENVVDEKEWLKVYDTFLAAVAQFNKFREDEGEVLKKDLSLRVNSIIGFFCKKIALISRIFIECIRMIRYLPHNNTRMVLQHLHIFVITFKVNLSPITFTYPTWCAHN